MRWGWWWWWWGSYNIPWHLSDSGNVTDRELAPRLYSINVLLISFSFLFFWYPIFHSKTLCNWGTLIAWIIVSYVRLLTFHTSPEHNNPKRRAAFFYQEFKPCQTSAQRGRGHRRIWSSCMLWPIYPLEMPWEIITSILVNLHFPPRVAKVPTERSKTTRQLSSKEAGQQKIR